jgi:thiamine-monophosphate kinase
MPSEFEIIRRYFERPSRGAVLGVGDDAALVQPSPGTQLAIATDVLLEGRHFRAGADPRALGHKSLAVNLSDMAAMGASPRWATLGIALPRADEQWLAEFAAGLFALAERFGVELVGGDTTRGPLNICIGIVGEVPAGKALLRSGARAGDDVWVTGELGGAALALEHPEFPLALERLERPEPRVALGVALRGLASAAIDVSDGFAQDLGHILERSGCGARVEYARLPKAAQFAALGDAALERRCVLAGGDDYELVFTAPRAKRGAVEALSRPPGPPLSRVGETIPGAPALAVLDAQGRPMAIGHGFDHFA